MAEDKKSEAMSDEELEKIIQDMAKADEEAIPEAPPVVAVAPVAPMPRAKAVTQPVAAPSPKGPSDQALTMELQGVVNLKVAFSSGGRTIEIICSEEALVCRMADGTEFRIPTGFSAGKRDAA